ncbi:MULTISPECIES: hypothetical protein [unclassified Pseudarthrobacter]|uniref:hypothetical protein n=1 Tax=unclassified Pseudarthrobacter TaxID=2647000 RepID=UPI0030785B1A
MMEMNADELAREEAARAAQEAALAARNDWKVLWARATYLRAISPSVVTSRKRMNISGAARALGEAYSTVRPYVLAGEALAREGRVKLTSKPEQADMEIVETALEEAARGPRRASRRSVVSPN